MKKGKLRKDIKFVAAWIEDNKILRCRGFVEDIEVYFKAMELGVPDPNGNMPTLESMKDLLSEIQQKIKKYAH